MIESIGRQCRNSLTTFVGLTEWLGMAVRGVGQLTKTSRRRIFWLLFKRQLFNAGMKAAGINAVIAILLGWLVMSKAYSLVPNNAQFIDYYAQFFVIVVIREIGPLISGIILIARSASAVTAEVGHMQLYRQFEALQAVNMNPVVVFILPVLIAFPVSLLLMFFYFNVICILSAYSMIALYHDGTFTLMSFIQALMSQLSNFEMFIAVTKALVGGALIGLTSLYFGYHVSDRITDISRAISNSNTMQLFTFFLLNIALSYVVYL